MARSKETIRAKIAREERRIVGLEEVLADTLAKREALRSGLDVASVAAAVTFSRGPMRNGKVPQTPMEKVILSRSLFRGRDDVSPTDRFVEETCEPFHAWAQGRPSIPPGVYLRMMMGIAWRWSDSLALRDFLGLGLGLGLTECVPDHVVDGDPEALANRRSRGSLPVRAEGAA